MSKNNLFSMQFVNATKHDIGSWWITHYASSTTTTAASGEGLEAGQTSSSFPIYISSNENDHFNIYVIDSQGNLWGEGGGELNLPSGAPSGTMFTAELQPWQGGPYEVTITPCNHSGQALRLNLCAAAGPNPTAQEAVFAERSDQRRANR